MERKIRRGDMYFAVLSPGAGSEQWGYRPVIILSNNIGNRRSNTVIAAVITSRIAHKPKLPTHCYIRARQGLYRDSVVLLEQLRTLDKKRLLDYAGALDGETMRLIDRALAVSVGLKIHR